MSLTSSFDLLSVETGKALAPSDYRFRLLSEKPELKEFIFDPNPVPKSIRFSDPST